MRKINIIRHISRLLLATGLSILSLKWFKFDNFIQILFFMGIYIGVSLIIEPVFYHWENKYKTKNNDKAR